MTTQMYVYIIALIRESDGPLGHLGECIKHGPNDHLKKAEYDLISFTGSFIGPVLRFNIVSV